MRLRFSESVYYLQPSLTLEQPQLLVQLSICHHDRWSVARQSWIDSLAFPRLVSRVWAICFCGVSVDLLVLMKSVAAKSCQELTSAGLIIRLIATAYRLTKVSEWWCETVRMIFMRDEVVVVLSLNYTVHSFWFMLDLEMVRVFYKGFSVGINHVLRVYVVLRV